MVMVVIAALRGTSCRPCNGLGRRRLATGLTVHANAICPDCGGMGFLPPDYIVESGTGEEMDDVLELFHP